MTTEYRIYIRAFGQACRVGGLAGPPEAVSIRQKDDLPGNTFELGHKAITNAPKARSPRPSRKWVEWPASAARLDSDLRQTKGGCLLYLS